MTSLVVCVHLAKVHKNGMTHALPTLVVDLAL
jgi:hypothetical protein